MEPLPIDEALPGLLAALQAEGQAVLQAPPGAGKTTRVPLAILEAGLASGRLLMLEPRRLAARAAAERMASGRGEPVGTTVGYRMRGESRVGPATRIEVLTEGILTRMLQEAPDLPGVGAVIFDEFHERSLAADLGLALCLEARAALRPDLLLVVMSATLDAEPVAGLMGGAPVVTAAGRAFPVDLRWLARPFETSLEGAVAAAVREALAEGEGDVLAFLPGEAEIRRTAGLLSGAGAEVFPLYGALPASAQRAALAPAAGRKVVLATSIAETSLTIPGVRHVVDGGRARRAHFDPGTGMASLVTERVTRAEAAQRAGRAGREAPGTCRRLWLRGEEGSLRLFPPPEIEVADLAPLALDLAAWGSNDLPFLTPPPAAALARARDLLADLSALDGGRITDHGRAMGRLAVHPRLAHMLLRAGAGAAGLAALLSEGERPPPGSADLTPLLEAPERMRPEAAQRLKREARRLARLAPEGPAMTPGAMAALAYPDRIAKRRPGEAPRFLLSGGRGAVSSPGDPLGAAPFLVVTDLDGAGEEARVRAALPVTESEVRGALADRIVTRPTCAWDAREGRVRARIDERLGALVLAERPWEAPPGAVAAAMLDGVRALGLRFSGADERLRARVALARESGEDLPDLSDAGLSADLSWLLPWLSGVRTADAFRRLDLGPALRSLLTHGQARRLDAVAPAHLVTPLGRQVPLDYAGGEPAAELRLQEAFGLDAHPRVGGRPVRLTLLSPAQRPLAVTTDLPGFWRGAYAEVRREMRGRHPRHPWPEAPWDAEPTIRAKPRGT